MSVAVAVASPAMTSPGVELPLGSDTSVEILKASSPSPGLALEVPIISGLPTVMKEIVEERSERIMQEDVGRKVEETLMHTPTPSSSSMTSSSSSTSTSPPPSTTTDTSATSDANHSDLTSNRDVEQEHEGTEKENAQKNDADAEHADSPTITTTPTPALISTPDSSSTSLPVIPPSSSLSSSASTSTSAVNIDEPSVDSNGLLSLLRPRLQSNQNLNVKFAPLPELAPRKRKSSTPLGMAARSQLARRRRMMYHDGYDDDGEYEDSHRSRRYNYVRQSEISEEEEIESGGTIRAEQRSVRKKVKKKTEAAAQAENGGKKLKEKKTPREGEQQSEADDPFVVLAKKIGEAGRHFWKKVANNGKNEKEGAQEGRKSKEAQSTPVIATILSDEEKELQKERQRQGKEEGGVWEEEVGEQVRKMQELRLKGLTGSEALVLQPEPSPFCPGPTSLDLKEEALLEEGMSSPTVENVEMDTKTAEEHEDAKLDVSPTTTSTPTPVL